MKKIKILFILIALMSIQSCSILQEYGDNFMENTGHEKHCYENNAGEQNCYWQRKPGW